MSKLTCFVSYPSGLINSRKAFAILKDINEDYQLTGCSGFKGHLKTVPEKNELIQKSDAFVFITYDDGTLSSDVKRDLDHYVRSKTARNEPVRIVQGRLQNGILSRSDATMAEVANLSVLNLQDTVARDAMLEKTEQNEPLDSLDTIELARMLSGGQNKGRTP